MNNDTFVSICKAVWNLNDSVSHMKHQSCLLDDVCKVETCA